MTIVTGDPPAIIAPHSFMLQLNWSNLMATRLHNIFNVLATLLVKLGTRRLVLSAADVTPLYKTSKFFSDGHIRALLHHVASVETRIVDRT